MGHYLDLSQLGEISMEQLKKFRTLSVRGNCESTDKVRTVTPWLDPEFRPGDFHIISWKIVGIDFIASDEAELVQVYNVFSSFKHLRTLVMKNKNKLKSTESIAGSEAAVEDSESGNGGSRNEKIIANLESIVELNDLEVFDMGSIPIGGNLSSLSTLMNLQDLGLCNSLIHGNLDSLS